MPAQQNHSPQGNGISFRPIVIYTWDETTVHLKLDCKKLKHLPKAKFFFHRQMVEYAFGQN